MPLILLAPVTLALLQAAPAAAPTSPTPVVAPAPTPVASPPTAAAPPAAAPPAAAPTPVASTPTPEPAPSAPPTSWYMPNAAPVPTTAIPAGEGPDDASSFDANKYRRLVFSNFYTLNFGIFPVPSGDFSFFLGTNLRPRKSYLGKDWNTALGYQLTLSVGGADYLYGSSDAVQSRFGDTLNFIGPLFYHRHALMAQGLGGRKGRFYYAMGGGAVMWNTLLVGIEGEAKLGYAFSAKQGKRLKGIFGGQVRLGGPFDLFPLPQFGLFIGFMVF